MAGASRGTGEGPDWIALYLEEDLGPGGVDGLRGDVTSAALFSADHDGSARMVARERAVVAGLGHAAAVFRRLGAQATPRAEEGRWVEAGATVLRVAGPTRAILAGERLALNVVARMSGIASLTRTLMERLGSACSAAAVAGTRKTTPGFRAFEKEAIRVGGGDPHRFGLHDAVLVKDNHLAAAGSVDAAVRAVRAANPGLTVECEVESLEDARAAAAAGADWLLIDNQPAATGKAWAEALWQDFPALKVEVSGGIGLDDVVAYGWADRISLGALTQRVPAKDFGLDWGSDVTDASGDSTDSVPAATGGKTNA